MKRKCVLGVLKTEAGLKIKEEMLKWLEPVYDVITEEVDPPNDIEFELPFLIKATQVSIMSNEPVLYLHTKGAAMQHNGQPIVRSYWQEHFGNRSEQYFNAVADDAPLCSSPIVAPKNKVCWYNGFVMNPAAAKQIFAILTRHSDRYWFEQQMLGEAGVNVTGPYIAECSNDAWNTTIRLYAGEKMRTNTTIITLAKQESKYIEEWLDYHTKLGITNFIVINNDDLDDNSLYDMEPELMKKYPVKFLELRGKDALLIANMQRGVLNWAYHHLIPGGQTDWVAFVDIDEFIHLDDMNVHQFLTQEKFADTAVIHLNWRCYGDCGQIYADYSKPVQERFPVQSPIDVKYNSREVAKGVTENMFCKSFVRILGRTNVMIDTHTSYVDDGICRRANGVLSKCQFSAEYLDENDTCYIKHYHTKSLEEFIDRRCSSKARNVAGTLDDPKTKMEFYFNENEKTPEKVKYVKDVLGLDV